MMTENESCHVVNCLAEQLRQAQEFRAEAQKVPEMPIIFFLGGGYEKNHEERAKFWGRLLEIIKNNQEDIILLNFPGLLMREGGKNYRNSSILEILPPPTSTHFFTPPKSFSIPKNFFSTDTRGILVELFSLHLP